MWLQLLTSNWPIPKSWECNFSFPFLFPKFGNGLSYSCSCSQSSISYSRSPLAPGGTIEQLRDAIVHNLMDNGHGDLGRRHDCQEELGQAPVCHPQGDVPRPQEDALQLPCQQVLVAQKQESDIFLFRDQTTGKFRPMSKVEDGTKFPTERSNRRDFPDTKEEFEEKAGEDD